MTLARVALSIMAVISLSGCAGTTPTEQMVEMMKEVNAQVDKAVAAGEEEGVPRNICFTGTGMWDLSGNPFVTANFNVEYKERAGDNPPDC